MRRAWLRGGSEAAGLEAYHFARWCSTTPSPLASTMPPGSIPVNTPNGAL
jgi:hypothetical protein